MEETAVFIAEEGNGQERFTASPPLALKSRGIGRANSRLGTKVSDFNPIIDANRWRKQGMLAANRSRN